MKPRFSNSLLLALSLSAASILPLEARAQTVNPGTTVGRVDFYTTTAAPTVAEASDFTARADSGGDLSADAFRFYNPNAVCYEVWYDVDNGSTAPTATSGCTLVPVDIATGDTAATVAGNTRTVLNAAPYTNFFAITGATDHVIVTSLLKGAATDGNIGTSGFTVSKTQGVSGSLALPAASVIPGVLGYRICNNTVNTSTWLAVGENTLDPELDGMRIGKGKCYDCPSCTAQSLKDVRVSAQAAANDYSVTQFKE